MLRNEFLGLRIAVVLLAAQGARASEVQYVTSIPAQATPWTRTVTLPAFDSSLGVLRQVKFHMLGLVSGTYGIENQNPSTSGASFNAWGYLHASLPNGVFPNAANPAFEFTMFSPGYPSGGFPAFDGTLDYGGSSGISHTFGPEAGTGSPSQDLTLYQTPNLLPYIGPAGNPGIVLISLSTTDETSGSSGIPPGFSLVHTLLMQANVSLTYIYDPLPASFCLAAPWDGCPCNNSGSFGCANSVNSLGASLQSSGNASISADTLVLAGSGMPSSAVGIYLQGVTMNYTGQNFGDGRLCMGGPFIRLGVKTNSGGASQYPEAGDLSISVRGGTSTPGTKSYHQLYYRDGAAFCTAASFNATNGRAILWGN